MASNYYNFGKHRNIFKEAFIEKTLIEKNYDGFACHIHRNTLTCSGCIKPTNLSIEYKFSIEYNPLSIPEARIIYPVIEYNPDIHMYKNGCLCLYYFRETPWDRDSHIYNKIIPWLSEWLIFYELYQIYGYWLGNEIKHQGDKITQQI